MNNGVLHGLTDIRVAWVRQIGDQQPANWIPAPQPITRRPQGIAGLTDLAAQKNLPMTSFSRNHQFLIFVVGIRKMNHCRSFASLKEARRHNGGFVHRQEMHVGYISHAVEEIVIVLVSARFVLRPDGIYNLKEHQLLSHFGCQRKRPHGLEFATGKPIVDYENVSRMLSCFGNVRYGEPVALGKPRTRIIADQQMIGKGI